MIDIKKKRAAADNVDRIDAVVDAWRFAQLADTNDQIVEIMKEHLEALCADWPVS